jgi:hypothetical protein
MTARRHWIERPICSAHCSSWGHIHDLVLLENLHVTMGDVTDGVTSVIPRSASDASRRDEWFRRPQDSILLKNHRPLAMDLMVGVTSSILVLLKNVHVTIGDVTNGVTSLICTLLCKWQPCQRRLPETAYSICDPGFSVLVSCANGGFFSRIKSGSAEKPLFSCARQVFGGVTCPERLRPAITFGIRPGSEL